MAAFYDPLARLVFGSALQRAQQAALAYLPPSTPSVLIVGGGTGWVLLETLKLRPRARILYLEASAVMLRKSQALLQRQAPAHVAQVEFKLGTEADLPPGAQFDALITFFLLDLFILPDLRLLLPRLKAVCKPGATWLVADFCPTEVWWQRGLLTVMYAFFRLMANIKARRLPPWPEELARLGLSRVYSERFFKGMIEAAVFKLPIQS
ncbi:class I SAM-dependent methyltransferase [Hymenobacter sp. BT188]|uniref:class I SAM-dependent methyltransferase n=1 Tax=Hymenobacter sp. BT188 TaxID=2763504 RepID=UPI001650E42C|nr:class I SAM-dependent methyltransferase [Hymenobacter sp. BT188]MBC6607289.1 class I SAM-dependent methyltransferase [Hymenobacter sp. BT188]